MTINDFMKDITKQIFDGLDSGELDLGFGFTKEFYREELKKTHPEWLPDLDKKEVQ